MLVETTHPITGKTKLVEMTQPEYEAMKILMPLETRIVEKAVNLHVNIHDSSLSLAIQTIPSYYDKDAMMKKASELMRLPHVQARAKKMNVTNVDIFTYDVKAHDIETNFPIYELQGK